MTRKMNPIVRIIALVALCFLAFGASLSSATAATITVTNTNDSGAGSLRQSIASAADGDTINFSVNGTIVLATQLTVNKALTIQGPAAPGIVVSGNNAVRVFNITSTGNVLLTALTISDGSADNGAGIMNAGASLSVTNSTITNNAATAVDIGTGGGGVFNDGSLTISNATLSANTANNGTANGGAVLNAPGATLFVSGSSIIGNSAARAGGGIENNGGDVSLAGVTLGAGMAGNFAGINGGGLHTSSTGTVQVSGGLVQGNTADQEGGGLWNSADGTLVVDGGTVISNNTANGDGTEQGGGGIFNDGGEVTVSNAILESNSSVAALAGNGGGGIFNDGTLTASNTFFLNNTAAIGALGNGGAILNSDGGTATLTGCLLQQNMANRAGGGIENNGGIVVSHSTDFFNNFAGINGGALHTGGAGSATLSGGFVSSNTASQEGGGLWNSSTGTLVVQATTDGTGTFIANNTAMGDGTDQGGGGVFNDGGTVTITTASIVNNLSTATAVGNGGGGLFNSGTLTLMSSEVRGNTALQGTANGGGILNSATGLLTVNGGTIAGNRTARAGGGVENNGGTVDLIEVSLGGSATADQNFAGINGGGMHVGGVGVSTVTRSLVANNRANNEGGGLWNGPTSTLNINNSTVSTNSAVTGGGVFNKGDGMTDIANSTIALNSASGTDGGVGTETGVPMIGNTIVALNTAGTAPDISGTFATQGYNLIGESNGGTGFTDGMTNDQVGTTAAPLDPLLGALADNGGPTFTHAVLTGSPAIDQGKRDTIMDLIALTDQRGMARPFDILNIANADGGDGSEIGAFELDTASLANLSTRVNVGTGEQVLIAGVIILGVDDQDVLFRGLGPSLTGQGVSGVLADPVLELYDNTGTLIATNDNWMDDQEMQIEDTNLAPTNDLESAIFATLEPGSYTAILRGQSNGTGVGLLELYGLRADSAAQFGNLSSRGFVDTGDNVLIAGLILTGNNTTSVLFRALGPSLDGAVSDVLEDPFIEIFDDQGNSLASNDNWMDDQQGDIEGTNIPPTDPNEAAVLIDLGAGSYTAVVTGANGTTGIGLVESYRLQ